VGFTNGVDDLEKATHKERVYSLYLFSHSFLGHTGIEKIGIGRLHSWIHPLFFGAAAALPLPEILDNYL